MMQRNITDTLLKTALLFATEHTKIRVPTAHVLRIN